MSSENENKTVGKHQRVEDVKPAKTGVPFAVTILLVILALASGCAAGYFCGANFSETAAKLNEAEEKIGEYELMFAGFYTDEYESETEEEEAARQENEGTAALTGDNVIYTEEAEVFIVVQYDGGDITNEEAQVYYEQALSDHAMTGGDIGENGDIILDKVLYDMASDRIAYKKAVELGLTEYTDKELAAIETDAQTEYDATVAFYAGEGADEETLVQTAEYLANEDGYTLESVRAEKMDEYWRVKLYDKIVAGVKVDADDVADQYNSRLTAQQEEYDAEPAAFEKDLMNGEIVVYYPAGYRTVKQIFFALDDKSAARVAEIDTALETETDAAVIDSLNNEKDAIYASAEGEAADVIAEFRSGSDFDELIETYSDFNALDHSAFSSTGYYVSEKTVMWPSEFVEAAMALENPGDISDPVRTAEGVYVVRYIANVTPGSVPLSNVSSRLTTETQEVMEEQAYNDQLKIWMEEANVTYYPERMK